MMKMKMTFNNNPSQPAKIQQPIQIQIKHLAYLNSGINSNIFQPIYNSGKCSSCGR